ncbi:MAG: cation transporter [Christensenellaceae bacterium]|nr:cation transporter [Christensenellaceae bacterium]
MFQTMDAETKKPVRDEGVCIITYCLIGNILLLLLKGAVGLVMGSEALKADAVNSAGDSLAAVVVMLGLRYSLKPQDEGHHYGHGKMEALVSFIVGLMVLAGTVFVIRDAVGAAINGETAPPSPWALGAALVSVAVKAVMFIVTYRAGKRLNSIAVMTNAMDHRNDIFATSGAAVAIGAAMIGEHFGVEPLVRYAEPVIALVISGFIVKTAVGILKVSSAMLLDAAPDEATMEGLREAVLKTPGVEHISWIKCRRMGRGLLADVAVEVDGDIRVCDGHDIADALRDNVMAAFPEMIDVVVHINPHTS